MISRIIFSKRDFGENVWAKVIQQIQLLLESGYVCTVCDIDAGKGTIAIEYSNISALSNPIPFFLYPDEIELVNSYRETHENENTDEEDSTIIIKNKKLPS